MILSSSTPPTLLMVTFGCAAWNRCRAFVKMPSSRPVKPLHTVNVTGELESLAFDALLLEELQAATALTTTHRSASCFLIGPPGAQRVRPGRLARAANGSGAGSGLVARCARRRCDELPAGLSRQHPAGRRRQSVQ